MKKKNLLIIVLTIGILFGIYTFINHIAERKHADDSFECCLREASTAFSIIDYSKMDVNERNYYFNKTASNLLAAESIKPYTSYRKVNNDDIYTQSPLGELYLFMSLNNKNTNDERRMKVISERGEVLFKAFSNLYKHPEDKKNWTELSKIVDEIGY